MSTALLVLLLLVGATPITLVFDESVIHGIVTAWSAGGLIAIALQIRPGEAAHLRTLVRLIIVLGVLPALWMAIQILPTGAIGLAHPIWSNASVALGQKMAGSISIDTGATLISLGRYLTTLAIIFVAAAVTIDRRRAGNVLVALTATTSIFALMLIGTDFKSDLFFQDFRNPLAMQAIIDCSVFGIIFAFVAAVRAVNRHQMQQQESKAIAGRFWMMLLLYLLALALCLFAVLHHADSAVIFAAAIGVAIIVALSVIRRFGLGPWGYSAIAAIALVGIISFVALQPSRRTSDVTLAFAAGDPAAMLTQRILTDVRLTGTGAGTFSKLLPIYRDVDEIGTSAVAPTAAAAISIELGRPALWAIFFATVMVVIRLLRGARQRGRDFFYPAAGAACIAALVILSLTNSGVFSTPVTVIAAAALGMGFGQSKSRSI